MPYTERYVRADAPGTGNGTTDSAYGANAAWTLNQAINNAVGGQRINIKKGTYTLAASITLPNGATESPIVWQGFNSTIGDLEGVGRATSTGELVVTDFPVIDGGASWIVTSTGTYSRLINLVIQSAGTGTTITSSNTNFWRCRFQNTNSSSVNVFNNSTPQIAMVDCDVVSASTASNAVLVVLGRGEAYGCRIWSTGTPNAASIGVNVNLNGGSIASSLIYNIGIAIQMASNAGSVFNCTWHNVTTGVFVNDDSEATILNNVGWGHSGWAIRGTVSSGHVLILNNALGSHASGRIDTSTLGSANDEINAILLTNDPFTNSGSQDYALNSVAGGGALCRAASKLFGGFGDLGAVQVQPAGGGVPLIGRGGLVY